MAGTKRSIEDRARLEAVAREMRVRGQSMAEIRATTGVSVSTLHRWASENGWREQDLAESIPVADEVGGCDSEPASRPSGQSPSLPSGHCPALADATPEEAVEFLLAEASRHAVGGSLMRAERAARLAQRLYALMGIEAAQTAEHEAVEAPADTGPQLTDEEFAALKVHIKARLQQLAAKGRTDSGFFPAH
jgi:hypothetical protein